MNALKRNDISGFTLSAFGYSLEVVTVRRWPVCVAVSKGARTICRIEI